MKWIGDLRLSIKLSDAFVEIERLYKKIHETLLMLASTSGADSKRGQQLFAHLKQEYTEFTTLIGDLQSSV